MGNDIFSRFLPKKITCSTDSRVSVTHFSEWMLETFGAVFLDRVIHSRERCGGMHRGVI